MTFNKYPYTDFHELNLDWIIAEIKKLHSDWDDFKVINSIRFFGEWNITGNYPAWALVSVGNIGYISTKPVPAGVPIDNTDYWKPVADYSALIADLQQRVVEAENKIAELEEEISHFKGAEKRIIILGDSYNISYDGTTEQIVTSVGTRISQMFPNIADSIIANWAVGGASFNVKSGEYTFIEYLDLHYADIPNRDTITDMLVFGGYNDVGTTYNGTYTGGMEFCRKVKDYFPNCTVHLAPVAWGTRSAQDMIKIVSNAYAGWYDVCRDAINAKYVDNSQDVLHIYDFCGADGVHPNDAGYNFLAKMLGSYLSTGNSINSFAIGALSTLTRYDSHITEDIQLVASRENSITKIEVRNRLTMSGGVHFTGPFCTLYTISGGIIRGFMNINNQATIKIPVMVYDVSTNNYLSGEIWVYDGYVALRCPGFYDLSANRGIIIFPSDASIPTFEC